MLIQTAIASNTTDPLAGHLVQAAVVLILTLQAWLIRAVNAATKAIAKMDQTLFGENGANGINGKTKDHEKCLDDHTAQLADHTAYIEKTVPERLKLWESFKAHTEGDLARLWASYHKLRNTLAERQRLLDQVEEDRRHNYGRRVGDL